MHYYVYIPIVRTNILCSLLTLFSRITFIASFSRVTLLNLLLYRLVSMVHFTLVDHIGRLEWSPTNMAVWAMRNHVGVVCFYRKLMKEICYTSARNFVNWCCLGWNVKEKKLQILQTCTCCMTMFVLVTLNSPLFCIIFFYFMQNIIIQFRFFLFRFLNVILFRVCLVIIIVLCHRKLLIVTNYMVMHLPTPKSKGKTRKPVFGKNEDRTKEDKINLSLDHIIYCYWWNEYIFFFLKGSC